MTEFLPLYLNVRTLEIVNEVISKRMVKKQQMRWTQERAHRMIQVRTATLNNELRDEFCRWYPNMDNVNDNQVLQSAV